MKLEQRFGFERLWWRRQPRQWKKLHAMASFSEIAGCHYADFDRLFLIKNEPQDVNRHSIHWDYPPELDTNGRSVWVTINGEQKVKPVEQRGAGDIEKARCRLKQLVGRRASYRGRSGLVLNLLNKKIAYLEEFIEQCLFDTENHIRRRPADNRELVRVSLQNMTCEKLDKSLAAILEGKARLWAAVFLLIEVGSLLKMCILV